MKQSRHHRPYLKSSVHSTVTRDYLPCQCGQNFQLIRRQKSGFLFLCKAFYFLGQKSFKKGL